MHLYFRGNIWNFFRYGFNILLHFFAIILMYLICDSHGLILYPKHMTEEPVSRLLTNFLIISGK